MQIIFSSFPFVHFKAGWHNNVSHPDFYKKVERAEAFFVISKLLPSIRNKMEFFSQISITETSD